MEEQKNETWLQIQADIFDATIVKLENEQGPALGAAIIAAVGSGMFDSYEACAEKFITYEKEYKPNSSDVSTYNEVYEVYKDVYKDTKSLNDRLYKFR